MQPFLKRCLEEGPAETHHLNFNERKHPRQTDGCALERSNNGMQRRPLEGAIRPTWDEATPSPFDPNALGPCLRGTAVGMGVLPTQRRGLTRKPSNASHHRFALGLRHKRRGWATFGALRRLIK